MKQRGGGTVGLRGSRAEYRNRSSDHSTNQVEEDDRGSDEAIIEDDVLELNENINDKVKSSAAAPSTTSTSVPAITDSLNVNAGEFKSQVTSGSNQFSPVRSGNATNMGHFPEPEVTGISFIALPSPYQHSSPAATGHRAGIYGDTSSNSPQLVQPSRINEEQSNSPINLEESTLKKMELSRKAWDNAPSQLRSGFNGFQATPGGTTTTPGAGQQPGQSNKVGVDEGPSDRPQPNSSQSQTDVRPFETTNQDGSNWGGANQNTPNGPEWSKDSGAGNTITGAPNPMTGQIATWGKQSDQWKKDNQHSLQQQVSHTLLMRRLVNIL